MSSFALAVLLTALLAVTAAHAQSAVIYDSIPDPLPYNLPSLGYQATSTQEFGDHIAFASGGQRLASVTAMMSTWALHEHYPEMDEAGFLHPITLNIYEADLAGGNPMPGALIATQTQSFLIPWRPAGDETCGMLYGDYRWRAPDGNCYGGMGFTITWDFSSMNVTLPDEIIFGLAFNTQTHGYAPIGVAGPYNSLNFAVSSGATTGVDIDPDMVMWNTKVAGWYSDGGAAGSNIFRWDTGWEGLVPAVRFETASAAPGPAVSVGHADVTLTGAVSSAVALPGDTLIWSYTIGNPRTEGTVDLRFLAEITDVLTFVDAAVSQGAVSYDPATGALWWDVGGIGPGGSATIQIETTLAGASAGLASAIHARVMETGSGKGIDKASRQEPGGSVCMTGAVASAVATVCTTVFPEELPLTGALPARSLAAALTLAAGALLLLGSRIFARRRQTV